MSDQRRRNTAFSFRRFDDVHAVVVQAAVGRAGVGVVAIGVGVATRRIGCADHHALPIGATLGRADVRHLAVGIVATTRGIELDVLADAVFAAVAGADVVVAAIEIRLTRAALTARVAQRAGLFWRTAAELGLEVDALPTAALLLARTIDVAGAARARSFAADALLANPTDALFVLLTRLAQAGAVVAVPQGAAVEVARAIGRRRDALTRNAEAIATTLVVGLASGCSLRTFTSNEPDQ